MKLRGISGYLFLLLLLIISSLPANCQNTATGRILNDFGAAIPFAVIHTDASAQGTISDIEGYFAIDRASTEIRISHPEYNRELYTFTPDNFALTDTQLFFLDQHRPLLPLPGKEQELANKVIREIISRKKTLNPENYTFDYIGYHKLTVRAARLEAPGLIRKIAGKFLQLFHNFSHLAPHLFMMESVTKREFYPGRKDKETIISTNATGVSQTSLLTPSTTLQPFNIFDDLFDNPSYRFISPLADKAQNHYRYWLTDSVLADNNLLYLINYKPKRKYSSDGIEGTLYIKAGTFEVVAITGKESRKITLPLQFAQSFVSTPEGAIFPVVMRLRFELLTGSKSQTAYVAEMTSLLQNIHLTSPGKAPKFDPVYLSSRTATEPENQNYWNRFRGNIFTPEDQQTYVLYDSLGTRKKLNKLFRFAEKATTGSLPIGKLDVNLHRLLRYNEHEGLRPGLELSTNQTFSEEVKMSAYAGYGINDHEWKYTGSLGTRIHTKTDTWLTLSGGKELEEAGLPWYAFHHYQFNSEWLRALRVRWMDEIKSANLTLAGNVQRDLKLQAHVSLQERQSLFNYIYTPNPKQVFNITEIGLGARYAFREKFIETTNLRHSIGSNYPIAWVQIRQGITGVAEGELSYFKTDAKITYRTRTLTMGTSNFQVIGGFVAGNVPYGLLFTGKGSLRNLSVVNHNSFETMRYNEFLSDRYVGLFISHQFGKLIPGAKGFEPTLEVLHNMGFGGLRNPQHHQGFGFSTMEKGYFESGFFVNDVFVFRIYLLKLSTGGGLFLRYGPYALPEAADNFYLKLSLGIGI